MKQKTYQLTIDSPCSQKLSEMTPTGHRQHFCSQCAKNVVDMRGRSREEVYKAYKSAKGELCTILYPEQLDSPFEIAHLSSFLNVAKHAIMSVVFFFVTERSFAHKTKKHETYDYIKNFQGNSSNQSIKQYKSKYKPKVSSKRTNTIHISGRIIDEATLKPITSAIIKLGGFKNKQTQTNETGYFRFDLLKKEKNNLKTLKISLLGKETKIDIDKKRFQSHGYGQILNFDIIHINITTGAASYLPKQQQKTYNKKKIKHCVKGKVAIRKKEPFFRKIFKKKDPKHNIKATDLSNNGGKKD